MKDEQKAVEGEQDYDEIDSPVQDVHNDQISDQIYDQICDSVDRQVKSRHLDTNEPPLKKLKKTTSEATRPTHCSGNFYLNLKVVKQRMKLF